MKYIIYSSIFPKLNGMFERATGTMTTIMLNVLEDRGDPNLALIECPTHQNIIYLLQNKCLWEDN